MIYTMILKDKTVFHTNWYDFDNNWNDEYCFMILNNIRSQYSIDGENWIDIEDDHL
ncbi:hypothetical protein [Flavobacterium sp.]|jgi:hypothetical protein|uniref:hypothetical protein n=1 Tax=Flavobacterium sp. TaxID=239 RepID=UPI0037C00E4A